MKTEFIRSTYAVREETKPKITQALQKLELESLADLLYLIADSPESAAALEALGPIARSYMDAKKGRNDQRKLLDRKRRLEAELAATQAQLSGQ